MSDNLNIYSPNDITVVITREDGLVHIIGGYNASCWCMGRFTVTIGCTGARR